MSGPEIFGFLPQAGVAQGNTNKAHHGHRVHNISRVHGYTCTAMCMDAVTRALGLTHAYI